VLENEPLSPPVARRLIRAIAAAGGVRFSGHAVAELRRDGLNTVDGHKVLVSGAVAAGEYEHGAGRYRVTAGRVTMVLEFESESRLVVVTGWKARR
jgi:hypothetical protein